MRKRFRTLLFVLVCAGLLTGCGKNIDKMTDEELYDYLSEMSESELTKETSHMTEEQQQRAAMVMILMEAQERSVQDDFGDELSIPVYEDTEEITEKQESFISLHLSDTYLMCNQKCIIRKEILIMNRLLVIDGACLFNRFYSKAEPMVIRAEKDIDKKNMLYTVF